MTARRFFVILILLSLSLLSVLFISNTVKAQTETEPADNFQLQAYLTEEQALSLVFPECDEILTDEFVMSPEEKSSLEKLLSRRSYEDGFRVYIGKKKGILQGYAIITEEIGKFHPFTFVVGVGTDGKISNVAVLVYRESRGGEIAKKRFLYQFMGKSFKNPIRINKDIINITGATMSVQCMCAGVRKVLAVVDEYYLSGKRNVSDLKVVSGNAVTSAKDKPIEEINKSQNAKNNETPPSLKGESGGLSEVKLLKQTRMIMGTFAEVTVYSNDEKTAGKAIEGALDEMGRTDRIMSNYKKDSELSRLNRNAVKAPVPCGAELLDVIEKSQYYSELSDGAFDITISFCCTLGVF